MGDTGNRCQVEAMYGGINSENSFEGYIMVQWAYNAFDKLWNSDMYSKKIWVNAFDLDIFYQCFYVMYID